MDNKQLLLSICIPTYNRKDRLLRQLKSIFKQPLYKQINIVILDNHSNYDIEQFLKDFFSEEEVSVIELIRRPFNIGMIGNVSNSFLYCKTKWMWLLSDDDETVDNSLEIIFRKIDLYPDYSVFKFSIYGIQSEENIDITTLDEFINYYKDNDRENSTGNLIFISNNVFNMSEIGDYLQDSFTYSYTYIPHIMPILSFLIDNEKKMKYFSEPVVRFLLPEAGIEWSYSKCMLGLSALSDFLFKNISAEKRKQLMKIFTQSFPFRDYILSCNNYSSYSNRLSIYRKIYGNFFKYKGGLKHTVLYYSFLLIFILNINKSPIFNKTIR